MSILDNLDLFEQHDREMEKALSRLPKCDQCEQPIQQEMAVRISGKWYCDSCHEKAPRGSKTGTQGLKGSKERSVIPQLLCKHIVEICEGGDIQHD